MMLIDYGSRGEACSNRMESTGRLHWILQLIDEECRDRYPSIVGDRDSETYFVNEVFWVTANGPASDIDSIKSAIRSAATGAAKRLSLRYRQPQRVYVNTPTDGESKHWLSQWSEPEDHSDRGHEASEATILAISATMIRSKSDARKSLGLAARQALTTKTVNWLSIGRAMWPNRPHRIYKVRSSAEFRKECGRLLTRVGLCRTEAPNGVSCRVNSSARRSR